MPEVNVSEARLEVGQIWGYIEDIYIAGFTLSDREPIVEELDKFIREKPSHVTPNKMNSKRPSLAWTLFLLFLFTTQIEDTEAGVNFKLKKLLKKVLLLRALVGKNGISIIPIPIPLNLFMKDKMEGMMMDKMPAPMMPPMPMYMPMEGDKMMGYPMMMPKANDMPQQGEMMMGKYGMMGGD